MVKVKELEGYKEANQSCWLVHHNNEHFFVSRIVAFDHKGWETMIFESDKDGNVEDWGELYSTRGWEELEDTLQNFFDLEEEEIIIEDLDEGDYIV